jgi:hypothetical protein
LKIQRLTGTLDHTREGSLCSHRDGKHSYLLLAAEQLFILSFQPQVHVCSSLSLDPSHARHTVSKIQRWALKLATYNYPIEYIAGELNVWTELLTRWGAAVTKTTSTPRNDRTLRYGALFVAQLVMDTSNYDFPMAAEVLRQQMAAAHNMDLKEVPPKKSGPNALLVNDQGYIWIPTNAVSMKTRLCVIAHCGRGGRRGHQVTLTGIQDHYYWKGMSRDIKVFVGTCFRCIASAPGETTPRPRGEALHASKPNEVIHFDYLYMGPSVDDAKYVLIVKDYYSNTFGSNNARTRMLTVQQPYSSNGSLPLVWLSNGFPTKAVTSRTP